MSSRKNINERKQAQWAVPLSTDTTFRTFLEAVPDAMVITDRDGKIALINQQTESLFGYSREELIGQEVEKLLPLRFRDRHTQHRRNYSQDPGPRPMGAGFELAGRRKDGSEFPVEISLSPLQTEEGLLVLGSVRDITDRKRTEDALERSEARFRQLVERSHVIPWEADAETWQTRYVGPQTSTILGYPTEKWYEKDFWVQHLHPADREWVIASVSERQKTHDVYQNEYRMVSASGEVVWIYDQVSVERKAGKPHILRGFMLDITDRKRAEEVLQESEAALRLGHEKLQYLAGELIKTQETERRRVALKLHEDVNQRLAALSIALSTLEKELSQPAGVAYAKVAGLQERTAALIQDVGQLSHQLHPTGIEHVGLAAGLSSLCHDFSRNEDIAIQLEALESSEPVPFNVALCLYRVTEESLRNIKRHSDAKEVQVKLATTADGLRLCISDDGVGFDVNQAQWTKGLGLPSMQERVRLLKGSFQIRSRPGVGTELEVLVPVGNGNT